MVKIGRTTRESIDIRMKELYSTGVPVPFDCAYACEVKSSDCLKIEKALHKAFEPNRINSNREFFSIKSEQAIAILELFDRKDITNEVTAEIDNDLTPEDKIASAKIKSVRRPSLNYKEMGIEIGSKLLFTKDSTIEVVISGDKKVTYQGEEISLTAITRQLLNAPRNVAPTRHWTFEEKNLRDIYDETYTLDES